MVDEPNHQGIHHNDSARVSEEILSESKEHFRRGRYCKRVALLLGIVAIAYFIAALLNIDFSEYQIVLIPTLTSSLIAISGAAYFYGEYLQTSKSRHGIGMVLIYRLLERTGRDVSLTRKHVVAKIEDAHITSKKDKMYFIRFLNTSPSVGGIRLPGPYSKGWKRSIGIAHTDLRQGEQECSIISSEGEPLSGNAIIYCIPDLCYPKDWDSHSDNIDDYDLGIDEKRLNQVMEYILNDAVSESKRPVYERAEAIRDTGLRMQKKTLAKVALVILSLAGLVLAAIWLRLPIPIDSSLLLVSFLAIVFLLSSCPSRVCPYMDDDSENKAQNRFAVAQGYILLDKVSSNVHVTEDYVVASVRDIYVVISKNKMYFVRLLSHAESPESELFLGGSFDNWSMTKNLIENVDVFHTESQCTIMLPDERMTSGTAKLFGIDHLCSAEIFALDGGYLAIDEIQLNQILELIQKEPER